MSRWPELTVRLPWRSPQASSPGGGTPLNATTESDPFAPATVAMACINPLPPRKARTPSGSIRHANGRGLLDFGIGPKDLQPVAGMASPKAHERNRRHGYPQPFAPLDHRHP